MTDLFTATIYDFSVSPDHPSRTRIVWVTDSDIDPERYLTGNEKPYVGIHFDRCICTSKFNIWFSYNMDAHNYRVFVSGHNSRFEKSLVAELGEVVASNLAEKMVQAFVAYEKYAEETKCPLCQELNAFTLSHLAHHAIEVSAEERDFYTHWSAPNGASGSHNWKFDIHVTEEWKPRIVAAVADARTERVGGWNGAVPSTTVSVLFGR